MSVWHRKYYFVYNKLQARLHDCINADGVKFEQKIINLSNFFYNTPFTNYYMFLLIIPGRHKSAISLILHVV